MGESPIRRLSRPRRPRAKSSADLDEQDRGVVHPPQSSGSPSARIAVTRRDPGGCRRRRPRRPPRRRIGSGRGDHLAVAQHRHDRGAGAGAGLGVAEPPADEPRAGRDRDLLGEQPAACWRRPESWPSISDAPSTRQRLRLVVGERYRRQAGVGIVRVVQDEVARPLRWGPRRPSGPIPSPGRAVRRFRQGVCSTRTRTSPTVTIDPAGCGTRSLRTTISIAGRARHSAVQIAYASRMSKCWARPNSGRQDRAERVRVGEQVVARPGCRGSMSCM